jgi:hypothetical protein
MGHLWRRYRELAICETKSSRGAEDKAEKSSGLARRKSGEERRGGSFGGYRSRITSVYGIGEEAARAARGKGESVIRVVNTGEPKTPLSRICLCNYLSPSAPLSFNKSNELQSYVYRMLTTSI